jgi:hypothetical protein
LGWFMWPGLFFLLYLFPSGHVMPIWARWFALGWGLFCVYGLTANILGKLPSNFLYVLPLIFVVLVVGGYAQVYRFRHANALERQQLKWVIAALLLMASVFIIFSLLINLSGLGDPGKNSLTGAFLFSLLFSTIGNVAFIVVPVSIALSMLRYRLWDVDIIIRRTLVYGILTIALGLVFFGGVTILQSLFQAVSGQRSAVSVVLSTLAIAALFNPLRRRIQNFIDRRFYRQKYNAEQALARFATKARSETDIEQLSAELVAVVEETMQPNRVALWLKPSRRK